MEVLRIRYFSRHGMFAQGLVSVFVEGSLFSV